MSLYKGNLTVKSRRSPYSLYRGDIASFNDGDTGNYNQQDAEGFINLIGLPATVRAQI